VRIKPLPKIVIWFVIEEPQYGALSQSENAKPVHLVSFEEQAR